MRDAGLGGAIGGLTAIAVLVAGCADITSPDPRYPDTLFPVPSLIKIDPPDPELAPGRKISEQDCSKPAAVMDGNLRCK